MSILDSFDIKTPALIDPENLYTPSGVRVNTCVYTFSKPLIEELEKNGSITKADSRVFPKMCGDPYPMYLAAGTDIGVSRIPVGAPAAVCILEEDRGIYGIKNAVVFGSCGVLGSLEPGKCIIPDRAYRDEGTSFHYAPPSDYIEVKNAGFMRKLFDEEGIGYACGATWTTDSIYRETAGLRDRRMSEGCLCVDMECSALQAACDFRGMQLYQFLYSADSLEGENWQRRILGTAEEDPCRVFYRLALLTAEKIESES
ncbi:MAG: nucleoside phosphorylase [Oscillospiraceae bacterium]|jgi:uridine phosphorylase